MTDLVLYAVEDGIAWITLNRPAALNAQNRVMRDRLRELFREAGRDTAVRAVIVMGAGERAFSVGADLKEVADAGLRDDEIAGGDDLPYLPKPVIAAIHGFCIAGGLELALRCDMRIASPDATFGLPEPKWSLLAGYGLHNLSRMVPLGEAMYMQLTGESISAERAHQIGLVQKIVPREGLKEAARALAERIKLNAPMAVAGIKQVVTGARSQPVEYSWRLAAPVERLVYTSADFTEGSKAFAEKRTPEWRGR
jgi:enoyl-CoA hydratase/carnithine racemase